MSDKLLELKTVNGVAVDNVNGAKPRNYDYFTDEMAAENGVTDPEEIQGIRDMLYQMKNEEPTRCDYYYDVYLKEKNAVSRST